VCIAGRLFTLPARKKETQAHSQYSQSYTQRHADGSVTVLLGLLEHAFVLEGYRCV
jgi:hypothetical protein